MSNVRILQDVVVSNSLTASDSLYVANNAVAKNLAVGDFGNTSPDSTKTLYVSGDTFIDGMLTVTGSANFVNTTFTTSSALSVVNSGTGPAIVGVQNGEEAIAAFYDDTNIALWVDGVAARPGHVGIGTKTPNEKLTVVGNISSTGDLFFKNLTAETANFSSNVIAYEFIGIGSQLTKVFGTDITKLPLSGGVLTDGLTGTTALFTTSLSALALSGSFYGDGSGLTGVSGIDGSKLSLSGGVLTDGLTGTTGVFTVSLSAPSLSANFYGDGSGLTGVSGIDGSKLPLAGGVLTGGLTGTTGVFTISLSAPNLSGSFYGDGSGLTNVTGTDNTKLSLTGGRIDGNLVINGALTALSSATFVNTIFTTTSALSVVNTGEGPALYVFQSSGAFDIASFYDEDFGEVFHIGNDGKIGVRESNPNKELTVNGEISAKNDIWADKFRGDGSLLTNVLGTDNTKLPLAGGTLTGGVIGTTAKFDSISAQSISGTFYGDISNGINVPHYFVTLRNTASQVGTVVSDVFTYTNPGALAAVEGVTPSVGDIILFISQSNQAQNGPWKVINVGGTGIQAVLERPSFYKGTVRNGTMFSVSKGTSSHGFIYACNASSGGGTSDIVVGTTALTITQAYARGNTNAVLFANTFTSTQTLAVGSATTAPLRFQAGTLLTTPVQHTVEWDGNFMYLTTSGANSARTTNVAFVSAPATSSSYGLSGQVAYDANFFYVCTANNTWVKTPLTQSGVLTDGTKLPLIGGSLTGTLNGTIGTFTTSLSSPNLSGVHFGDGSRLTGIASGLPLGGGTLTGGLTGTTATFTTSISSPNLSGTFYGDGGNLFNIPSQINFIFDGAGSPVENNSSGYVQIPYNTKITGWTLLANQNSTSTVQVLTSNFSNHPTYTVISGSANQPALVNASKASSSTLTGWVTAIPADAYLQFVVASNDVATNLTISLKCARSS